MSATHQGIGDDAPAIAKAPYQFVSQNQRRSPEGAVSKKSGNVRATDSGNCDRNFFFPGARFRPGTLLKLDSAGSGID